MKKLLKAAVAISMALTLTQPAFSQDITTESNPIDASFYTPKFFGTIFAAFNASTYSGETRVNVRNSRFGVKGKASADISYQVQVDFSNQGSLSVLDSYVKFAREGFDFTLGQQRINLTEDMKRGPSSCLFTSRAYTAISSIAYPNGSKVSNLGSRDLGGYANYTFGGDLPIQLGVGLFNGNGANNPEWDNHMNFTSRVVVGSLKSGVSGDVSYYGGKSTVGQDINIWSGELRYVDPELFVEAIYQQRRLQNDGLQQSNLFCVQGYYNITLPNSTLFDGVAPALRWDMGDGVDYAILNSEGDNIGTTLLDAHRLTMALNFQMKGAKLRSRIAVGYEKIFMSERTVDMGYNPLMHDKLTLAFIASF